MATQKQSGKRYVAIVGSIDFSDVYIVLSGTVAPGTTLAACRSEVVTG